MPEKFIAGFLPLIPPQIIAQRVRSGNQPQARGLRKNPSLLNGKQLPNSLVWLYGIRKLLLNQNVQRALLSKNIAGHGKTILWQVVSQNVR